MMMMSNLQSRLHFHSVKSMNRLLRKTTGNFPIPWRTLPPRSRSIHTLPRLSLLRGQIRHVFAWGSRSFWTSVSECHGPLRFVAPQTRLRVVDNSPWSNIAPGPAVGDFKQRANPSAAKTPTPQSSLPSVLLSGSKSVLSKPALCIRVYNSRNRGRIGDKVIVAVGGQKKKGWIVGVRQASRNGWPRFESNNIVLVDDEGNPLGTRILVPIPSKLFSLKGDISKILSIATTFV